MLQLLYHHLVSWCKDREHLEQQRCLLCLMVQLLQGQGQQQERTQQLLMVMAKQVQQVQQQGGQAQQQGGM